MWSPSGPRSHQKVATLLPLLPLLPLLDAPGPCTPGERRTGNGPTGRVTVRPAGIPLPGPVSEESAPPRCDRSEAPVVLPQRSYRQGVFRNLTRRCRSDVGALTRGMCRMEQADSTGGTRDAARAAQGEGDGLFCWPGALSRPWPLAACLSTFHWAQPGCFGPTTFQPPAHGGRPAVRSCLPSIASTSTSVEPSSSSPWIVTRLPTDAASGEAAPHHHFGPAS